MAWVTSYSCTGCAGGLETHRTRRGAWRLLVQVTRAARKGYPLAHRCGGELFDVQVGATARTRRRTG